MRKNDDTITRFHKYTWLSDLNPLVTTEKGCGFEEDLRQRTNEWRKYD